MGAAAVGMWRMWYGAVLGFMALLAIIAVIFTLLLIEASNVLGRGGRAGDHRRYSGTCSSSSCGCCAGSRCRARPVELIVTLAGVEPY